MKILDKHIFSMTFATTAIISVSKMIGIELPVWTMVLLVLFTIAGGLYGCMVILQDLGGMKRIMADADEEGGMR